MREVLTSVYHEEAAKGHDYGEPEYIWNEDDTKCTARCVCKNDATHVIDETVDVIKKSLSPATCEEAGQTTYAAIFINHLFKPQYKVKEDSKAIGHKWGEPIYSWDDDYSTAAAYRICENDEDHVELEVVNTTGEVTKKPTCTAKGELTYTATYKNSIFAKQTKTKEIDIDPEGHAADKPVKENVKAATCTEAGSYEEVVYCSLCKKELSRVKKTGDASQGHKWGEWTVTKKATETETGIEEITCSACGAKETRDIAKVISKEEIDKQIISNEGEKDLKDSNFTLLMAKGVPVSKKSIKLTWKKVPGATEYIIYGNKCGKKNKYKRITSVTSTKLIRKKLKVGTYYKHLVVAINEKGEILATSKTIHCVTNGGKNGNNTKVVPSKKSVTLSVNKTKKITAKLKTKKPVRIHRPIAWESDNPEIATVSDKGKIKAVAKGTCYVYAYAQNGVYAKIKVTVK